MISGVILARNEEDNIIGCLESLAPYVDEIVLLDMESTDATVKRASGYVSQVLSVPLVPAFDAARNRAIAVARYDWLWFVDADERIPRSTGNFVRQLVRSQGEEFEALTIPFKTYFCGQWMQHCGWWPGYTMPRVLKRGHFRFREELHGGVELSGRELRVTPHPDFGVEHFSYRDIEHYLEKLNRYTSTEAAQLRAKGGSWDWQRATCEMIRDLWSYYELNPGDRDGELGWILAWLSGQYRWLSYAKLAPQPEPANGQRQPSVPRDLDEVVELMGLQLSVLRSAKPQLPLGVIWRSPIWDPSGYADDARCFVKALATGGRELQLQDIRWTDRHCALPPQDAALLRALSRARRPKYSVTITECMPLVVEPDPSSSFNILRTFFETDRLPAEWPERIERFDEVWVSSEHTYAAFARSGVAPEKLRIVHSCIDSTLFQPAGDRLPLPDVLADRFVFLSIFDWGWRKGWDVLLSAYAEEFAPQERVGLLLKLTRSHGHSMELIRQQLDQCLALVGQSHAHRPDIVLWDKNLEMDELACLYRSVSAFVLPSRGEGWGRPYMEAMASGLPTIGTGGSSHLEFMDAENSLLLPAQLVDVPETAAREIPTYRGHRWFEPDRGALRAAMRRLVDDAALRARLSSNAVARVRRDFTLTAGLRQMEQALADVERRFVCNTPDAPRGDQIRVRWEGEFAAPHSFATVNDHVVLALSASDEIALSLEPVVRRPVQNPPTLQERQLSNLFQRNLGDGPHFTVRHSYPPNWIPPESGRWIHIQPWEYGHLPSDWLPALRERVEEIWLPSQYARRVYIDSGIDAQKIHVVPWGIDTRTYHPGAIARLLPTRKNHRFLFVGGTIPRKGFDRVLEAYLAEFRADDDVCLVIKDVGSQTFYRHLSYRDKILTLCRDRSLPEIVYFDDDMTPAQLAGIYRACNWLVAPYRGEGFGLPILEAMACGVPPIVPQGGASDDFVSSQCGLLLRSREIEAPFDLPLCGPATELSIELRDLRQALRRTVAEPQLGRDLGSAAAECAREFTWKRTAAVMTERLKKLHAAKPACATGQMPRVGVCVLAADDETTIGECLARLTPFVDALLVADRHSHDRTCRVAHEYGAQLLHVSREASIAEIIERSAPLLACEWLFTVEARELITEQSARGIRGQLNAMNRQCPVSLELQLVARQGPSQVVSREAISINSRAAFFENSSPAGGREEPL